MKYSNSSYLSLGLNYFILPTLNKLIIIIINVIIIIIVDITIIQFMFIIIIQYYHSNVIITIIIDIIIIQLQAILNVSGNIARRRPTRQSSTGHGGASSRAVDGNKNTQWGGGSCTHTNKQQNPWWRVDLGSVQKVKKVKLTNRGDCCSNRLRNIEIRVGNTDGNPRANPV